MWPVRHLIASLMSVNVLVLLDVLLEKQQEGRDTPLPEDEAFEFLACASVLRDANASDDEIHYGIVGGGGDGAIDGVFTFLDDQLVTEDSDIFDENFSATSYRRGVNLKLHLIQAKRTQSFNETTIDLVSSSTSRLLNLQMSEDELCSRYSALLVNRMFLFRQALIGLATRHPTIHVDFSYATRGDTANIHPNVERKGEDLAVHFRSILPDSTTGVVFLGAEELRKLAGETPSYTVTLQYQENATSGNSHVALVFLRDYLEFLIGTDGTLKRHIFDWNVRDFQGFVEVNREIRGSLENPQDTDFWWLNNGVTIICSKVSIQGKTYTLDDVQIVNGLQTSHTIYHALHEIYTREVEDPILQHKILVRILETDNPTTRDRVIRATNRQTSVPVAQLRATDDIQRSIEMYFESKSWFYDRRKNYYRNLGKPTSRIVGIPFLAQSVMAIGLSRPDDARARPSSLLKTDVNYKTIFSEAVPLEVYLWTARVQKKVDAFLQIHSSPAERTNLRFHLSMLIATRMFGREVEGPEQMEELAKKGTMPNNDDLLECLNSLRAIMENLVAETGSTQDRLAKGREFVEAILRNEEYSTEHKGVG